MLKSQSLIYLIEVKLINFIVISDILRGYCCADDVGCCCCCCLTSGAINLKLIKCLRRETEEYTPDVAAVYSVTIRIT